MTDQEKMKSMFDEVGVEHKLVLEGGNVSNGTVQYDTKILVEEGFGYSCFVCEFYFLEGKFVGHGVWE